MKPHPMSESEIVKYLVDAGCIGAVKMTFESGPYDITRTSINADRLVRAIIAARDAQWAAMIGEPVATLRRGKAGVWLETLVPPSDAPIDAPLYAIKETP